MYSLLFGVWLSLSPGVVVVIRLITIGIAVQCSVSSLADRGSFCTILLKELPEFHSCIRSTFPRGQDLYQLINRTRVVVLPIHSSFYMKLLVQQMLLVQVEGR